VCVLSHHHGRLLEFWGQAQACSGPQCQHIHYTRETVDGLVRDGTMRWIGRERNIATYTYGRTWETRLSEGYEVKQLV